MGAKFTVRKIVSVEEYQTAGVPKKKYAPVGILKEITMENGSHFFTVTLNQNPGVEYKVYDMEPKKDKRSPDYEEPAF